MLLIVKGEDVALEVTTHSSYPFKGSRVSQKHGGDRAP